VVLPVLSSPGNYRNQIKPAYLMKTFKIEKASLNRTQDYIDATNLYTAEDEEKKNVKSCNIFPSRRFWW